MTSVHGVEREWPPGPGTLRGMRSSLGHLLALAVLSLVPSSAAADVVFPLECPPGLDIRGHHERDCWPRTCTSDAQCGDGASCRQVSRCVETRDIHEGDSPEGTPRDFDQGPCTTDGACTAGGACRQLSRCEPTEATPSFVNGRWTSEPYIAPREAPTSMCAASAPGHAGHGVALLALAALGCALARRRRG